MSKQNHPNVKLFRPFGPTIMEMDMPEEVVNNVNNYVEKIIKDKEKSRKLDAGGQLVGCLLYTSPSPRD